jgi:hypothetical protein
VDLDFAEAEPSHERAEGPRVSDYDGEPIDLPARSSRPLPLLAAPGRTLPVSLEAEELLLACIFLDGGDVLRRCEEAKIEPGTFYETKHGILYDCQRAVFKKTGEVAIDIVAEELKQTRQLEEIGGIAFLMQVSSRVPTTAQASYFVEKVREQAALREIIRAATGIVEDCHSYSGDLTQFAAEAEAKITRVTRQAQGASSWSAKALTDFALPPANDPTILLGKYRYLCRGGGLVLVGSSGTGKSSSSLQMAALWALGRDFLGITCAKPLRSLVVVAEDDEGDIAECWLSLRAALKLTADEIALVRERVLIVEDRINTGDAFLAELAKGCALWKPDIVVLNPFLAFAGCAISEQSEMSRFLRGGLNRVNADKKWAYIIVHHTNKPPSQKDAAARNWNEYMYNMAGSAELPNWARGVITIEAKKKEGQFVLRLAKRGKRAGVTKTIEADPEAGEGACRVEIVTKIDVQHSSKRIQLEDGRTLQMMVWEPGEASAEEVGAEPERTPRAPLGRKAKHGFADFSGLWPVGEANAKPFSEIKRILAAKDQLSDGALSRLLKQAMDDGHLRFRIDADKRKGGYYVPA